MKSPPLPPRLPYAQPRFAPRPRRSLSNRKDNPQSDFKRWPLAAPEYGTMTERRRQAGRGFVFAVCVWDGESGEGEVYLNRDVKNWGMVTARDAIGDAIALLQREYDCWTLDGRLSPEAAEAWRDQNNSTMPAEPAQDAPADLRTPADCRDMESCARNRQCMYRGCPNSGWKAAL